MTRCDEIEARVNALEEAWLRSEIRQAEERERLQRYFDSEEQAMDAIWRVGFGAGAALVIWGVVWALAL